MPSRCRFFTATASVKSTVAPLITSMRKRSNFRMHLRWTNNISTFLRFGGSADTPALRRCTEPHHERFRGRCERSCETQCRASLRLHRAPYAVDLPGSEDDGVDFQHRHIDCIDLTDPVLRVRKNVRTERAGSRCGPRASHCLAIDPHAFREVALNAGKSV